MDPLSSNSSRAYSAAHFALTLDGSEVGMFRSIEGGGVKVDAMSYQTGGSPSVLRFPGKTKFEEFKVTSGMAMGLPFYKWLKDFFDGKGSPKNGEIIAADFSYKVRARRRFTDAVITECTFPKLDAGDKGPANMTVSIAPTTMEFVAGDGTELKHPEATLQQKLWAACNFDFQLHGFPKVTGNVSKVDALTVKQKVVEYHTGNQRHASKFPGRIELPNLTFYVPEAHAYDLLKSARTRGYSGAVEGTAPLSGNITTYSNDRTPIFEIGFSGGEVVNMTIDKSDAGSEEIKQVKFEVAIQTLSLSHKENDAVLAKFDAVDFE